MLLFSADFCNYRPVKMYSVNHRFIAVMLDTALIRRAPQNAQLGHVQVMNIVEL